MAYQQGWMNGSTGTEFLLPGAHHRGGQMQCPRTFSTDVDDVMCQSEPPLSKPRQSMLDAYAELSRLTGAMTPKSCIVLNLLVLHHCFMSDLRRNVPQGECGVS